MIDAPKLVLITGAGPTGMMAVLELSRFGIPVRLVEKALKPATTSRAVGVQAHTLELFGQRGLAASLVEKGNKGVAVSHYGGGKRVFRLTFDHIDSAYPDILFVSQAETEGVLRAALKENGVAVEWGVTMTTFGQPEREAGPTATLKRQDGGLESLECSASISSEGAHSTVRQTLGLAFEGKSLTEDYALGDFHIDRDLPDSDMHIFSSEDGIMGMFPMGDRRFRLIASNPISKPPKDTQPSIEELQAMYDRRSHIPVRFRDLSWSSWFRINSRMVDIMRVGHVFVGGDAAHVHSSAGAQGMNTGMQDMVNLGWKLAMFIKGQAKPELLDTYGEERIPAIKNVLTTTEGLTQAIGEESHIFRTVFNHIAPWVANTDLVQKNSTERMSQLAINYRGGSLAASGRHAGELPAGDRMPDLPVTELDREGAGDLQPRSATTFDPMDPCGFTLFHANITGKLLDAGIGRAIDGWQHLVRERPVGAISGTEASFKKLFGGSHSIALVRPDCYVASIRSQSSAQDLAKHCEQWLVPARQATEARAA